MFTDIEGYTTMFHLNEKSALGKIEIHRQHIDEITSEHKGQIIQFYGDGSLIIFNSVIDAVRSAIEIQHHSIRHQIPVRIGIHLGDLIQKEGSIYGDVVNVASRIQAIGVAGSIVISRKIADELDNHPEIITTRLGKFDLKNVQEQLELFAITGHGLKIPEKPKPVQKKKTKSLFYIISILAFFVVAGYTTKYFLNKNLTALLKEEKIAVPPFDNFTTKTEFNTISQMAAHWITTELIESVNANVVSYQSSLFNMKTSDVSAPVKPSFARQTGAINMIRGAFSFSGENQDSLVFWANILNIQTGKPLPIQLSKAYCKADDPLTCIRELSNEIKGFWKSKNAHVLSPPNYDAYKAYLQAMNTWDGINDSVPESYLRQAIFLDPQFLDAYFLLLDLFFNQRNYPEASDTLRSLKSKFTELTPRQENFLLYYEENMKGRRVETFKHFMTEYETDPKDLFMNTSGMVMALEFLNDPATALKFEEQIDDDSLDLSTCLYCRERAIMALQANARLGNTEKANQIAEKLRPYATQRDDYMRLIEWYIFNNDTSSANALLQRASMANLDHDYRYLFFVAGRQAALKGDIPMRNYYANQTIQLYKGKPSRALARAYYLKDDLSNAEKTYDQVRKEPDHDKRVYAELGMIYAKLGNLQKATEMINKLEQLREPFDLGETPYFQGRIMALLGDKEKAIQLLNKALDEGQLFVNSVSFNGDPDLMGLNNEEEYKKLLSRNRQ